MPWRSNFSFFPSIGRYGPAFGAGCSTATGREIARGGAWSVVGVGRAPYSVGSRARETGVPPVRVSFIAALRFIVDEWSWSTNTSSPGAIPRHLDDLRDKIRRFVLPPRRPERSYPRAVKIKMSNYARKRPSTVRRAN